MRLANSTLKTGAYAGRIAFSSDVQFGPVDLILRHARSEPVADPDLGGLPVVERGWIQLGSVDKVCTKSYGRV